MFRSAFLACFRFSGSIFGAFQGNGISIRKYIRIFQCFRGSSEISREKEKVCDVEFSKLSPKSSEKVEKNERHGKRKCEKLRRVLKSHGRGRMREHADEGWKRLEKRKIKPQVAAVSKQ